MLDGSKVYNYSYSSGKRSRYRSCMICWRRSIGMFSDDNTDTSLNANPFFMPIVVVSTNSAITEHNMAIVSWCISLSSIPIHLRINMM